MRMRSLLAAGIAVVLLTSGCTAQSARQPTASASPSPSATPTSVPIVEPTAAFDLTCDDVAAEMLALVGEPSTPVAPVMSVVSTMSWVPGPAQHMFQRANGIACSAGDVSRSWEITVVPGAAAVISGASERGGYSGEQASCEGGYCVFEVADGDVLLSAAVHEPVLGAADVPRVEEALRRLASAAAASIREVEYIDSDLVGASCDHYITPQEVSEIVGADALLFTDFGGWGIPAEVYEYVNGSRHCYFTSSASGYDGDSYLMITSLPAGAWAFERQDSSAVVVEGAESAKASTGEHGERILDVQVGVDWIRFMTYDNGSGASDPVPLAEKTVHNLTIGRTAPR